MTDMTDEQRRYQSNPADLAREQDKDAKSTAKKIPADKSEQKTTTSTEGEVERTTKRSGDRG